MTTLIDSNILIDIFGNDPVWYEWSALQIRDAIARGAVIINDTVYAESSIRYESVPLFEESLTRIGIDVVPVPREALFMAGKVFAQYRRAEGQKTGVLPDFFIGAHAVISRLPLLTRDARRYRTYFPTIDLIAPEAS